VPLDLSEPELERYAAQIEHIGIDAQRRLKAARVVVLGGGPAGAAAAAELVSRGVGYVAVVDGATVAPSHLCGQAMLYTPDIGANRAEAIVAKLGVLNPHVHCESYPVDADAANAEAIVLGHDVVVDCAAAAALLAGIDAEVVHCDDDGIAAGAQAAGAAIELIARAGVAQ
jgi:sulfur-carrier protein adenylyltransferase/sulfurtransferase